MPEPAAVDQVGSWLEFDPDGTVLIRSGKVELGQGIHEALAILVADELDLELDRVHVAPVDTASSRDEGTTAGSRSIEESGTLLRRAAATARRDLIAAAARRLGTPAPDLAVAGGVISASDGRSVTYADLTADGKLMRGTIDPAIPVKDAAARRLIGSTLLRRDLVPKVTGVPAFLQDLDLPGMLHGRIIRPPSYTARLSRVDEAALLALPGVVSVARDGDFLGIVAEREDQAVAALARAERAVTWSDAGPSLDATSDPRSLLELPSEEIVVRTWGDGPPAASVARTLEAEYSRPYIAHGALAPSCSVALLDADGLQVWSHSQGIFRLGQSIAVVLGIDADTVRVRHLEGAGCYGHNGADDAALDAALLARANPGRPVRVQWTREDEFAWEPYGPAMLIRLSADLSGDGSILAWRHDGWGPGHDSRPSPADAPPQHSGLLAARHLEHPFVVPAPRRPRGPASGGQRNMEPYYRMARGRIVDHHVAQPPLRVSSLRSLGAHANVFAIESFMHELALANGEDPVTFRLRHLDDERARAVIEVARDLAAAVPQPVSSEVLFGRGLGFARYKNRAAYAAVVVEVELDTMIRVRRVWAAVDAGMVVSLGGLRNQAEGGIIQAIGWTLSEAVTASGSRIASRDWDSYHPLRFADAPSVEVRVLDRPDMPPFGAGEAFAGPTSAAVANAVAHASGVRLRAMPFTVERFVEALDRAPVGSGRPDTPR